jgi:hypothetical protein
VVRKPPLGVAESGQGRDGMMVTRANYQAPQAFAAGWLQSLLWWVGRNHMRQWTGQRHPASLEGFGWPNLLEDRPTSSPSKD